MKASLHGTTSWYGCNPTQAKWVVFIFLWILLVATPSRGQNDPGKSPPKVLMIELYGLTPNDTGLFKAIRAQLSAAPLVLDRIELVAEQADLIDPLKSASRLAEENQAAMVFWIEDKEACTMSFYIPGPGGGSINSRVLELDVDSQSSRFEVIAIAVASMVEGLLVSQYIKPAKKNGPSTEKVERKRTWLEVFAAYAGSYFAADMFTHGARLGLGFLPLDHLVIAASFTQNFPLKMKNEELRLKIISRIMEVSLAGRLLLSPVDIRLGLAWSIDVRSFSTTSLAQRIEAEPDGFNGVNALTPFFSMAFIFAERIGLFGRLGASLAMNETVYKIERYNTDTEALAPFFVKLTYQFGVIILI
jgi:hypothetical protein